MAVLPNLAQMQEELAKLRAENEALKAKKQGTVSLKVTEKGGLSMYGLGRFPVTLYRGQWERLLGHAEQVRAFIEANAGSLSVKD